MSLDYSSVAATASKLLTNFGRSVILRTRANSGSESNPTITESDTAVSAVSAGYSLSAIDGSLIQRGDIQFVFASVVVPTDADAIIDGDYIFEFQFVEAITPGDTVLLYKAQARK